MTEQAKSAASFAGENVNSGAKTGNPGGKSERHIYMNRRGFCIDDTMITAANKNILISDIKSVKRRRTTSIKHYDLACGLLSSAVYLIAILFLPVSLTAFLTIFLVSVFIDRYRWDNADTHIVLVNVKNEGPVHWVSPERSLMEDVYFAIKKARREAKWGG